MRSAASSNASSWDRRIRRADQLASEGGSAASLLEFYARLLRCQKDLYVALQYERPAGAIERDARLIAHGADALLLTVAAHGPDQLAADARLLLERDRSILEQDLLAYWHTRVDRAFFPKALLQPYVQWLTEAAMGDAGAARVAPNPENRCPRCGGAPQVSILESTASGAEGGGRRLLCATCLTPWPFRRVVCAACGEEDERKLATFRSDALKHVRVEACDGCGRYVKAVDLEQDGLAVPLVDEIAGAPLDLWAREHDYEKIELNLVGL